MEAFSAEHNVSIEELLYEWPASKFQAFYSAYTKRKVADELATRRSMECAALWGNMNYDSQEQPEARQKLSDLIDERYSKVIAHLYGEPIEEEVEIDEDDPFWQAMERGLEKHKLGNSG